LSRAALRALNDPRRAGRWIAVEARHLGVLGSSTVAAPAPVSAASLPVPAPDASFDDALQDGVTGLSLREATDAFQRRWIAASLERHAGQVSRAAREAGMDRSNFHRLARRLGVLAGRDPDAAS
jgi:anaerobic nitric oxide reductase transcription regulator